MFAPLTPEWKWANEPPATDERERERKCPWEKSVGAQPTARLGKLPHHLCGANTQTEEGPFTLATLCLRRALLGEGFDAL